MRFTGNRFCGRQEQRSKIAARREKEKARKVKAKVRGERKKEKARSSRRENTTTMVSSQMVRVNETGSEAFAVRRSSYVDRAVFGDARISGEIQEAGLQLPAPLPATLQMSSAPISEDAGVRPPWSS